MSGSALDGAIRLGLKVAFAAAQAWWFVRRPQHTGALVAVWSGGQVLLLRQSYQPLWTMPGGGVRSGEVLAQAAARELAEEVGIVASPGELRPTATHEHVFRWRHDRVAFFDLVRPERPRFAVDGREIVLGLWVTVEEALALPVVPHVREYLRARAAAHTISGGTPAQPSNVQAA